MCSLDDPLVVCGLRVLYELGLIGEVEVITPYDDPCDHDGLAVEAERAHTINEGRRGENV
ncbi:hypothetical protein HKD37_02G005264 [Glycine soja]